MWIRQFAYFLRCYFLLSVHENSRSVLVVHAIWFFFVLWRRLRENDSKLIEFILVYWTFGDTFSKSKHSGGQAGRHSSLQAYVYTLLLAAGHKLNWKIAIANLYFARERYKEQTHTHTIWKNNNRISSRPRECAPSSHFNTKTCTLVVAFTKHRLIVD